MGVTDLEVDQWYNLSMEYDRANLKLFVNGVEDNSVAENRVMNLYSSAATIGFGERDAQVSGAYFNGTIDELKVYGDAINGPEVCGDNYDNDFDNLIDCKDPDCFDSLLCPKIIEVCDNGVDDDTDGLTDCNDILDCGGFCIQQLQGRSDTLEQQVSQLQTENQGLRQSVTDLQQENSQLKQRTSTLESLVQKILNWIKLFTHGKAQHLP